MPCADMTDWQELNDPDGRKNYRNDKTRVMQWTRPPETDGAPAPLSETSPESVLKVSWLWLACVVGVSWQWRACVAGGFGEGGGGGGEGGSEEKIPQSLCRSFGSVWLLP